MRLLVLALWPLVTSACWDNSFADPHPGSSAGAIRQPDSAPNPRRQGSAGTDQTGAAPAKLTRWRDQLARASSAYRLMPERKRSSGALRDRLWLMSGTQRIVDLLPRVQVSYHRLRRGHRQPPLRTRWLVFGGLKLTRDDRGGWSARAEARTRWATHTLTLEGSPGDPRLQFAWEARYHRDQLVGLELARFTLYGVSRGTMMDRAYTHRPLSWRQFAGTLSPRQLLLTVATPSGLSVPLGLIGGAGLQGLYVRHRSGKSYSVDLELDHHLNHPYRRYRACVKRKKDPVGRRRLSFGLRRAGSRRLLWATWLVGPARLLSVSRFPRGHGAAMVLCDHADQSSRAKLEALAFGRTGALKRKETGPAHPGLVNRGLAFTKTIFIQRSGPYARQMEDPVYHRLLQSMARQGIEVGVHSPTGRRDPPANGRSLLDRFRASFKGRTWVDHQPNTNCEAIGNKGWDPRSPWYMLGHLSDLDFRYIWSGRDVSLAWGSLNLLAPAARALRRPMLYHHSRLDSGKRPPFVFFTTAWGFVHHKRLQRYMSPRWIQRLVDERGLFMGHMYLDTYRRDPWFERRSLLRPLGARRYALRPEVDRIFRRLASRQARGDLWVAGLEAVAGHLLAAMEVQLDHLPRGQVLVTAPAGSVLRGLTLRLPPDAASALVDGRAPAGRGARRGAMEIWFDLHPGKPRLLQLMDAAGEPLELLKPARIALDGEPAGQKL